MNNHNSNYSMAKKSKSRHVKQKVAALIVALIILPILIYAVYQQINLRSRAFDQGYIPPGYLKALRLMNLPQTTASVEVSNVKNSRWQDVWTIEGWFKPENVYPSTPTQQLFYIPLKTDEAMMYGTGLSIRNGQLYGEFEQSLTRGTLNAGPITATWHHIAFVNDGKYCFIFVDGIQKAKTTGNQCVKNDVDPAQLIIERVTVGSKLEKHLITMGNFEIRRIAGFIGQIDEFRLSLGQALYTSNFTRPKTPFPEKSGFIQFRFDALGANNLVTSAGYYTTTYGYVRDTRFQLVTSGVPYTPPPSTITPTPTQVVTPTLIPTSTILRPPPASPFY